VSGLVEVCQQPDDVRMRAGSEGCGWMEANAQQG
jgi:hypothetical protein